MGSVHGPRRGKKPEPPRETRYRLKGRVKRLVDAGAKEKRTVSTKSCRHEVMLLQRAVRWWSYKYGLALEKRGHPVFEIKLPAKSLNRERRFEAGEVDRLFAAIDDDKTVLGRALTLLLESGMRRSELAESARWENLTIEHDCAVLWLPEAKHPDREVVNGRFVSLSPRAVAILRPAPSAARVAALQMLELVLRRPFALVVDPAPRQARWGALQIKVTLVASTAVPICM